MTTQRDLRARLYAAAEHLIAEDVRRYEERQRSENPGSDPADVKALTEDYRDREIRARRERIARWVTAAAPRFHAADLATIGDDQANVDIRAWLSGDALNLLLAGPVGTGKSHVSWAIAHEMVTRGAHVMFATVPRLLLDMRPDGDPDAFRRACRCDLLVLDDLAAARPTDWATEQMYSIVDERSSHLRRTVVTTNATWDQLVALWGAPTMDRIRDRAAQVLLTGHSRRGAA